MFDIVGRIGSHREQRPGTSSIFEECATGEEMDVCLELSLVTKDLNSASICPDV